MRKLNSKNQSSGKSSIQESRDYLDKIINTIADPIFVKDRQHRWVFLNDAFCQFIGHARYDLIGRSDYDFFPRREADVFWDRDEVVFKSGKENVNEEEFTDAQGIRHIIVTKKTLSTNAEGEKLIVGIIRDISERKKIEEALRASEDRFKTLVANVPGVIYRCKNDASWTMEFISHEIFNLSGYPASDFLRNKKRSFTSIIHPDDRKKVDDLIQKALKKKHPYSIEYRIIHATGDIRWVYEKGQGITSKTNALVWLDGAIFDITAQKLFEEKLRALSIIDDLTKLHNRRSFLSLAEQQLKMAKRYKSALGLLFIDLDKMKWINDHWGHREGDKALMAIAKILKHTFRDSDVVARYGGDEFVILAPGVDEIKSQILISRLIKNLAAYNKKGSRRYKLAVSVGVSCCGPTQFCSLDELMTQADKMMYKDKQNKGR